MKLRFVKFFTSRENEIEKKEGEDGGQTFRALSPPCQPAARPPLPLHPPPAIVPTLSSSTQLHQPASSIARLACRHGSEEQCPPAVPAPAVLPLPSFFIKLPKRKSVEGRIVAKHPACRPSCPTQ